MKMRQLKNKGTMSLSINAIVIIIIAITLLSLAMFFIRRNVTETFEDFEQQIPSGDVFVTINVAGGNIHEVYDNVTFHGLDSYVVGKRKIKKYIWDFGDNKPKEMGSKINHRYFEPGDYDVTLYCIDNKGGFGKATMKIRVFTKNKKDLEKYEKKPLFIIPERGDNWREILQLVPVTAWYSKDDHLHEYPYIVYYTQGLFYNNKVEDILKSYTKNNKAIVFDSPDVTPGETAFGTIEIGSLEPEHYTSYWKTNEIYSVVLVDYYNEEDALIASLFAAYYNSPIFFVKESNIAQSLEPLRANFDDLTIYVIGICDGCIDHITSNNLTMQAYTANDLREGAINRIIKLESDIKIG